MAVYLFFHAFYYTGKKDKNTAKIFVEYGMIKQQ